MPLGNVLMRLFDDYKIDYAIKGKNVAKGNIGIQCPFCGDDTGYHLGINLASGKWGCWKNAKHAGRHAASLISYMLGITYKQATKELELTIVLPDLNLEQEIDDLLKDKESIPKKLLEANELAMPDTFRKINKGATAKFFNYLCGRFDGRADVTYELINQYNLRCSMIGAFAWRVIFPIYMEEKFVNYLGRTIYKDVKPRYKWEDNTNVIVPAKDTLYDYDHLKEGGDSLFIAEGPLDAMKMGYICTYSYATCLYNMTISPRQLELLYLLAPKFDKLFIVFDRGTLAQAMVAYDQLSITKKANILQINERFKDPGEMPFEELKKLLLNC